jgi:hypothetical protein
MKAFNLLFTVSLFLFFVSCEKSDDSRVSAESNAFDPLGLSDSSAAGASGSGNGGEESGLVTAAEWSDLENWDFWTNLIETSEDFISKPDFWRFFTDHRIAVHVVNEGGDLVNAEVELVNGGKAIWQSKTDNFGLAQLYINSYENNDQIDLGQYQLLVEGRLIPINLKFYEDGINMVNTSIESQVMNRVELAFVVDATGSMSDEIEFLKKDLEDVIQRVQAKNPLNGIYTSSVFYRDEGDEYVTKVSDFHNISNTIGFILNQSAGGGGDFPEAVHSALNDCLDELSWSNTAKTRIAFLLLDAPPHNDQNVITDLQVAIKLAAKKGIKIIPITASGIDKSTEYLMRSFSILTNSPYVFITNDSGIGNPHLEASVGDFEVEFLNDLMVRLISKYSE